MRLTFIRHGQASFGAADYDVLSPIGVRQSGQLGTYLAELKRPVARIVTGRMTRQRDTAQHAITAAASLGHALPTPTIDEGFDEYPAFEILAYVQSAHPSDPDVRTLLADVGDGDPRAIVRAKERAIFRLLRRYAEGAIDVGPHETFAAFTRRVHDAMDRLVDDAADDDDGTRCVVTSGGPVCVAVARALSLSAGQALDLAWTTMNASFTELLVREGRLALHRFNAVPHLEREGLLTFR